MDSFIIFHENDFPPKPQNTSSTMFARIPALGHLSYFSSTICISVVAYLAYRSLRYLTSEFPPLGSGLKRLPGPISTLPYVGRVHDVDRMRAWNAMKKFSDEYDGLFACTLGGETHIWIAREDLAQDLLVNNSKISSARADLGSYPDVTQDFKYLPLLGFTDTFHRQRKFAHSVMTRCATNKYYGHINSETKRLMHDLVTTPSAWWHAIHLHCARVSSKLAYGCVDQAQDHVTNADKFLGQIGPSGPVANLLPFLAHFPEWLVPGKRGVRKRQETEAKLWKNSFDKAKYDANSDRRLNTYTSASIAAKTSGEEKGTLFEKQEEAQCAVGMLCTVGVFTIAGPATLFVMAMILNPDWQKKVRNQIDEVVQDQMLDISHSPRLPILRAAIKECLRWKSTVPLGKQTQHPFENIQKI
jgi:cytochrome P450